VITVAREKNIVVALPVLSVGGTERQTLTMTEILCGAGYSVTVLCYYEYDERVVASFIKAGADVQTLKLHRDPDRPASIWQLLALLWKLIEEFRLLKPSIVHVQYLAPGFIPIIAAKIAGVKVIFASLHYPRFMATRLEIIFVRWSSRLCTLFLCNSRATEQSWFGSSMNFDPNAGLRARTHYTLYNGIDIEHIQHILQTVDVAALKSTLGLRSETVLGVVARLHPGKGHRFLFDSLRRVIAENANVVLLVIGDGQEREELHQYSAVLGIDRHLRWCGAVMYEEALRYYALIDLLIVPSQYEGFGLTAAEAMAAGLPVIASDVDGLREVVDDGNSGLLVPFGDVEKMSSALLALLSNPERARSMGKNGKLRIEKLFSVAIFHNAIVDAYAQL